MEKFLILFEEAIKAQADVVGRETACEQAKSAGLGISPSGSIVSCTGNPMVVLLKLIKSFTRDGNMAALAACEPLIVKLTEWQAEQEKVSA
ncbi:MAG: hypothetical protein GY867_00280 [bacterium]|nr:hypothetical protein [bacterium]